MTTDRQGEGIDVLVADDHEAWRVLLATVLQATPGVASVVEAVDGVEAVELGRTVRLDVAVLDLSMPRLDGVGAALRLRDLQPRLQIALDSGNPQLLRDRGCKLELPLFDKTELDRLLDWVELQARHQVDAGVLDARRPVPLRPWGPREVA